MQFLRDAVRGGLVTEQRVQVQNVLRRVDASLAQRWQVVLLFDGCQHAPIIELDAERISARDGAHFTRGHGGSTASRIRARCLALVLVAGAVVIVAVRTVGQRFVTVLGINGLVRGIRAVVVVAEHNIVDNVVDQMRLRARVQIRLGRSAS